MRRTLIMTFFAASAVVLAGCNQNDRAGGPGATNQANKDKIMPGTPELAFTLDVPNLATDVKQGEVKIVSIAINRGRNFDQDITLSFDNVPKGVAIDPSRPVLKRGEPDVKLTLKAADDAALGSHMIKIAGNPTTGPAATNEFKVNVKEKK